MGKRTFETCTPEEAGIPSGAIETLLDDLAGCETEPHGLMILRRGRLCFSAWWKPYAPELVHGLQSLTKTFSGTAVGLLISEGKLSLDTRVTSLFPELVPPDASEHLRRMTVRDVLCMGTGMETAAFPTEHWVEDFFRTPVPNRPGTAFYYNNPGSNLLARIVKQVSGQSMMDYLEENLFPYLGIEKGSITCLTLPDGTEVGGGGMAAHLEDCVRLMLLYMNHGAAGGKQLLSEEYVRLATSCQNAAPNPNGIFDCRQGYGFQMWQCSYPGAYRADGAMGQYVVCFPQQELIVAIHETASYPVGVQQVLEKIYALLPAVEAAPLPEDTKAYRALLEKAEKLAVPAPFAASDGTQISDALAGCYRPVQGKLPWVPAITWMVVGKKPPEVRSLTFRKETDWALLLETSAGDFTLTLPTNGAAECSLPGLFPYDRVLVQARACAANRLEADLRYVQTCYHVRLGFCVEGDTLRIETNMSDMVPVREEATAIRQ